MAMQIQEEIFPGLYRIVDTQWPEHGHLVTQELQSVKWHQVPACSELARWAVETPNATRPMMQILRESLTSLEWKRQVCSWATSTPMWQTHWGTAMPARLLARVSTYADFVRLPAQYREHPWHCDTKNLVVHGILYLEGHRWAYNRGTWFRTWPSDPTEFKVPSVPGTGWLLINHDRAFHRALNHSDQPRHCLKFGLSLW